MSMMPNPAFDLSYQYPSDIPAERRVLGILVKFPHLIDEVVDSLKPEYFFDRENRLIYRVILELYQEQGTVSYTQIYNRLRKEPEIVAADQVLIKLTESFISKTELEPSIETLRAAYGRRKLLAAVEEIEKLIAHDDGDLTSLRERAQELIFAATSDENGGQDEICDLKAILSQCYNNLLNRSEGSQPFGLLVRYPSIDSLTTGFKKKDLIILAGRPSMGKTALALNFAVNVAKRNIPVLIFSLEMDSEQIGDRIVIGELFSLRDRNGEPLITSYEYNTKLTDEGKVRHALNVFNSLNDLPLLVVDKRGLTTVEIRAKARKVKSQYPDLGLIIIDYLQLIKPPADQNRNWALVVGDAVRELRDLAGELGVPIILLSQLNRGVEARDNKRPVMSDLRDSGNIEEFADLVMFVYRDEYYYPDQAEARGTKGVAEVIIGKNRKGQTGKAILQFIPEFAKFVDITDREPDN
ncbi:MAG: replicative DNA helicase [Firmicutes bacterium]|nr:replicative DNA helicase [Bacillota bacterium]